MRAKRGRWQTIKTKMKIEIAGGRKKGVREGGAKGRISGREREREKEKWSYR